MITKMSKEAKEFFRKSIKQEQIYICPLGSTYGTFTKAIHQVSMGNPYGKINFHNIIKSTGIYSLYNEILIIGSLFLLV